MTYNDDEVRNNLWQLDGLPLIDDDNDQDDDDDDDDDDDNDYKPGKAT